MSKEMSKEASTRTSPSSSSSTTTKERSSPGQIDCTRANEGSMFFLDAGPNWIEISFYL
jgi:hypothetical protein